MNEQKKLAAFTLGCKVNTYDTEAVVKLFSERGYDVVDFEETADIYIINTCTVTNLGDKKSRQLIRRAKRQNPSSIVVVMGCYAQTAQDEVKKIEGVNIIVGTKERASLVDVVEAYSAEYGIVSTVSDIMKEKAFERLSAGKFENRTRAYLKIQDGCNQFCTYCIIPYARGNVRSRLPQDVLDEVKTLAENGFKEVVLAGIHVASYGKDLLDTDLLSLIKKVHEQEGIERIRFSSLEPNLITEHFVNELTKMSKICNHFHLSLQSGCDKTLTAMNRRYTTAEYERAVKLLRESFADVSITTDMIVGFPGETDEDFEESFAFAKKIGFSKIHVFPYSPKKGTKAASFKNQLDSSVKNERATKLITLSDEMAEMFRQRFVGKTVDVLFETKNEENIYCGHTTNYLSVCKQSDVNIVNEILPALVE